MNNYFGIFSSQLGIDSWLFAIIVIWSLAWTLIALWIAARKKHVFWFIILGVLNTFGVLEILYIYIFSKIKTIKQQSKNKKTKSLKNKDFKKLKKKTSKKK